MSARAKAGTARTEAGNTTRKIVDEVSKWWPTSATQQVRSLALLRLVLNLCNQYLLQELAWLVTLERSLKFVSNNTLDAHVSQEPMLPTAPQRFIATLVGHDLLKPDTLTNLRAVREQVKQQDKGPSCEQGSLSVSHHFIRLMV